MDKQVSEIWNMVIDAQSQLNKDWMFRSEGGILGNRKSFLIIKLNITPMPATIIINLNHFWPDFNSSFVWEAK